MGPGSHLLCVAGVEPEIRNQGLELGGDVAGLCQHCLEGRVRDRVIPAFRFELRKGQWIEIDDGAAPRKGLFDFFEQEQLARACKHIARRFPLVVDRLDAFNELRLFLDFVQNGFWVEVLPLRSGQARIGGAQDGVFNREELVVGEKAAGQGCLAGLSGAGEHDDSAAGLVVARGKCLGDSAVFHGL